MITLTSGGVISGLSGVHISVEASPFGFLISSSSRDLKACFEDGVRRVDYVLAYHVKKTGAAHRRAALRGSRAALQPRDDPEVAAQQQQASYHDDDKRFSRTQFEEKLLEMGLQLERDEESNIPGIGFLKIHAPWNILCREAEFLKLKMPTKKVYEVNQGNNIVENIRLFIHKVTAPLHPKVDCSRPQSVKPLSHPFSREKQHLWRSLVLQWGSLVLQWGVRGPLSGGSLVLQWGVRGPFSPRVRLRSSAGCDAVCSHRKYFGEKVGLYFAWLGVYTQMLIPAAIVGVIVFLYGCATVDDDIPSMEICDPRNNITMCPMCDSACSYWRLSSACGTARASHLFDNPATVFFSIFMALWAVLFMEHWKRRQMRLNYIWDLTGYEEEECPRRLCVVSALLGRCYGHHDSPLCPPPLFQNEKVKLTCTDRMPAYLTTLVMMAFMITVTFAIVFGVILYRITIKSLLHFSSYPAARSNIRATVKTTAAIINLIAIIIMDEIYAAIARWLTRLEVPKTDKSFEDRLIFKTFILKFVNAFTPIVYLAFFRGRLVGRPGSYLYVVGSYRMEECAHAGCLMELCIQLCITMLGKQLIQNNLFEIGIPKLKKLLRRRKTDMDAEQEAELNKRLLRHEKDHQLGPFGGLAPEYMEMIIQFGMVTLFVASFPLAPLFALLNNIIEIRLDAKKFVMGLRRPIAVRAKDIGIWYNLLRGLSKVAVIVNAFVISFTSDFIPRLVYQYMYSPDGSMHGFVNHTLSVFNTSDFQTGTAPLDPEILGYKVPLCRYKDYREPPGSSSSYEFTKEFWAILAARLAFVILFQNVVMLMSDFIDWLIPDIPKDISLQIHKEKILMVELFMKEEQSRWYSGGRDPRPEKADPSPLLKRSPLMPPPGRDPYAHTANC
uniref:Anoctamin n=1 Tax=Gadus morhua TaxID=8049 RepID=A0A8C5C6W6_GADMO